MVTIPAIICKKINSKLFEQIIAAFKINGKIVEINRTTHEKCIDDFFRCTKLSCDIEICFIDDLHHPKMIHDNVYYIHQFSSNGTVGIITSNIRSDTSVVGISTSGSILNPVGKYSWGRLSGFTRSSSPISIGVSGNTVDVGLSTFPTIQRRGIGIRQTGALPKLL